MLQQNLPSWGQKQSHNVILSERQILLNVNWTKDGFLFPPAQVQLLQGTFVGPSGSLEYLNAYLAHFYS